MTTWEARGKEVLKEAFKRYDRMEGTALVSDGDGASLGNTERREMRRLWRMAAGKAHGRKLLLRRIAAVAACLVVVFGLALLTWPEAEPAPTPPLSYGMPPFYLHYAEGTYFFRGHIVDTLPIGSVYIGEIECYGDIFTEDGYDGNDGLFALPADGPLFVDPSDISVVYSAGVFEGRLRYSKLIREREWDANPRKYHYNKITDFTAY